MNCIPNLPRRDLWRRVATSLLLGLTAACGVPASESSVAANTREYRIIYDVAIDPGRARATIRVELKQAASFLRELRWRIDADRMSGFTGDGDVLRDSQIVTWLPPENGGKLTWTVSVPNQRGRGSYDAWLDESWGLFRAEDIIPRAATRTLKGAISDARLTFRLPRGWSVVTQYADNDGEYRIQNAQRRFDQPTGWIVMGKLGVRRETISGVRVTVAAPVGESVRRMDMLALLNWTLPELARILPELPGRLTIVSAGAPMWRGGLSAPQSLFIHAERPLLSENATSTLLHEVLHTMLGIRAIGSQDWIDEGLAEYYALLLLQRSGTITARRFEAAVADFRAWAEDADGLCGKESTGATTALAVGLFTRLDQEIVHRSRQTSSLDDAVRALARLDRPIDLSDLAKAAEQAAGDKTDTLHSAPLPGCRSISARADSGT